jgi:hypothetical protein
LLLETAKSWLKPEFWIRIRILLFSSVTFKMPTKIFFFSHSFYAYSFLKVHLHNSSKIKSHQVTKQFGDPKTCGSCGFGCGSGSGTLTKALRLARPYSKILALLSLHLTVQYVSSPRYHTFSTAHHREGGQTNKSLYLEIYPVR